MSLILRLHVNLTYQTFNKTTGVYSDPQSLGIKLSPCTCTPETTDPYCRNERNWVTDWRGNQAVTRRCCPRRFGNSNLWDCIYLALYELKELGNALSFYGIPVAHLGEPVYQILKEAFAARDRYQAQRAHMERV